MTGDLVILVPDKDTEQTIQAVLARPKSLGIRALSSRILVHPQKDPGCYSTGAELLRTQLRSWQHGLVLFDRAWEGAPSGDREVLERKVQTDLDQMQAGWGRSIVIDPELEVWLFTDSPRLDEALGWSGRTPDLRAWLRAQGEWPEGMPKPPDPEKAFRKAMYEVRLPAAASLFGAVARTVSLVRCRDASFVALVEQLRSWFPPEAPVKVGSD